MRKALFAAFNHLPWKAAAASGREAAEWQMVTPWGTFPNSEGDQVITAESTAPMVAALNARDDKAGGKWPGLPIFEDHPDTIDPSIARKMGWTNTARIGHFWRAEARPDGLYVLQAWNTQGAYNGANGIRRYPSGYWYIKSKGGQVVPTGFRSIGMTEEPNIKGVSAWNSADADGGGDDDEPETTTTDPIMDPKKIAKLLGLDEASAPEAIEAAIVAAAARPEAAALNSATTLVTTERQRADAEKARADKAAADLVTATGEKAALNTRIITGTLDRAIETNRITQGQRKEWEEKAALNSAALDEVLKLRTKLNTAPVALDRATQAKAAMNSAAAQDSIKELVAQRMEKSKTSHQAAWNAVVNDPKNKALVAAMNGTAIAAE
jgi:hypothetical protein